MAKFLFVYRRASDVKISPEGMQQRLDRWRDWIHDGLQKGWLLDRGDALAPEGCVIRPSKVVSDGPFVESKEIVGGYTIVQADTIQRAIEIAHGCPVLFFGGSVEVRPLMGLTLDKN
jgi:hypothetical protein